MAEHPALGFGGLVRQLRAEARLTQEELAEAARLSPRSVSDLERGINRTAHKDTAELLAGALGLAEPTRELFVAAARGQRPSRTGAGGAARSAAPRPRRGRTDSPYRGLRAFEEQDAALFFGRDAATAQVLERMSQLWRARACWWCRGCRARGSRRCCGRGCCHGSGRGAGGRAGVSVLAAPGVHPHPGAAG